MSRYRRRGQSNWHLWLKLSKLGLLLAAIGAASFYAYQVGQRLALEQVDGLKQQIEELTAGEAQAKDQVASLTASLDETRKRADEFQAKYAEVAPSDDVKDLLGLLRTKMAAGLDAKRLAFVISQAERPRRCGEASTKRFMVRTPKFNGDSTWVRFDDLITVTAQGTGGNDGSDQWYDPDKPVSVKFTVIGGKEVQVDGKLPLQHAMVVKNGEFRFTVTPGARGFIEVTGDRCEYRG